ncbi:hypothetical protein [Bosea sp. (in: a-proteobacteria)]|uniref:hypothetical protein n=1 Tax=Bosea sp. (in: a-proteobacteria) TaxID=1871050 RepID=UPI001ACF6103|nr:hypothetical protein [Bosea sp. (in: a-proteobacteria)]MBN9441405.1 hypothetical protein [Bosea sp. (in: a-proteobacteria)]
MGAARDRLHKEKLQDPLFGHQYWNLDALIYRENAGRFGFFFDRHFPDPIRNLTARELAMQRLNAPLRATQIGRGAVGPTAATTVLAALHHLRAFYDFMDENGINKLTEVDQEFLDRYLRFLKFEEDYSDNYRAMRLRTIFWLYESRSLLSEDWINFAPWGGRSSSSLIDAKKKTENSTPRIPENVMDPLLRWSFAYIDYFSKDLIALNAINDSAPNHIQKISPQNIGFRSIQNEIRSDLALDHFKTCEAEPARDTTVFMKAVFRRASQSLKGTAQLRGIDVRHALATLPSVIPEYGQPWRPPFVKGEALHLECRNLIAACYIVCTYLSGMRDSEIQAIATKPVKFLRDKDGDIVRIYLTSKQYKGRSQHGEPRTWVVLQPVSKAIEVMEKLGMLERSEAKSTLLFTPFNRLRESSKISLNSKINRYLNGFVGHINTIMAPWLNRAELGPIPIAEFQPITTMMFRRTIAWYIANRPFGIVAGMLQYGHASVQMFEGYAGSSGSGFKQEIEKERALSRMADIVEMYAEDSAGTAVAGPMAPALTAEFEYIRDKIGDYPGTIVDTERRDKMLSHLSKSFYPGLLADCFFDPSRAKCMEKTKSFMHDEPVRGLCDPNCENACWRKKHVSVWKTALADVERLSRRNRLSPIQRDILRTKKIQYKSIIDAIDAASPTHAL